MLLLKIELWCERFCAQLRLLNRSERTVHSYWLETRLFLKFLAERGIEEVADIRRDDVKAYRVHLHEKRKPNGEPLAIKTQSSKLAAVFAFLKYLYEEAFIVANPSRDMKLPRVPDSLPSELPDEEQVLRLLEAPDTECFLGLRDRTVLELVYSSALRNAEVRALKLEDIDLHRLQVRVASGKGQKERNVPLGEPAAIWLEAYIKSSRPHLVRNETDVFFLNRWGRPFTSEVLSELVRGYGERVKLPMKVTPHILRHCCATHMLAHGAGLRHLQRLLGHSSSTTTERYTRVEVSDLREVFLRCHPRELS